MSSMTRFYCGVKTQDVYVWFSIIPFTLAVCVAVSEGVELRSISNVAARCGENVTLPCEAEQIQQKDLTYFAWVLGNKECNYSDSKSDPAFLCERTPHTLNPKLTMTLLNVMPANQGKYICKLHSLQGVKSTTTVVTIQDCLEASNSSIDNIHAKCSFRGVYPNGIIHWFQGDVNITDSARPQEEEDQHGRYNVWSTIGVQKGTLQPYKCSLWIPSAGKYLSSRELPLSKGKTSSGNKVKLQWIVLLMGVVMVKSMT